eukprot:CAMPEP_0194748028 /NCGR_PEP_ID=MMETSP0323_2-20130528/2237_1 /TAXON_ID=2866 ORGANISM="Crypthecodinium cohnii, Strain Seligo" /NCGR_SAMPLE_ID=MMETSP0323_2 /ASSEMBLY_ACC=CAM_ASM_000346 /LENGTH=53 /DNA_ID=CAMNT_0039662017 /DNA_START=21 /DNA_END=182 /DNA_ORIENTATION=+
MACLKKIGVKTPQTLDWSWGKGGCLEAARRLTAQNSQMIDAMPCKQARKLASE